MNLVDTSQKVEVLKNLRLRNTIDVLRRETGSGRRKRRVLERDYLKDVQLGTQSHIKGLRVRHCVDNTVNRSGVETLDHHDRSQMSSTPSLSKRLNGL